MAEAILEVQHLKTYFYQDDSVVRAADELKEVFGKPQVSMFEMAGLIGKHVS